MPITKPYSLHPIKIASASGAGTITFKKLQEPTILPAYSKQERMQSMSYTRPSATHPGKRIFASYGSSEEYYSLEMQLPYVFPEDYNTLLGWYLSRPGVVLVSIDGGINRYYALWKKNGLQEECYYLNQREFYKVNIKLDIIAKASTNFDNMVAVD